MVSQRTSVTCVVSVETKSDQVSIISPPTSLSIIYCLRWDITCGCGCYQTICLEKVNIMNESLFNAKTILQLGSCLVQQYYIYFVLFIFVLFIILSFLFRKKIFIKVEEQNIFKGSVHFTGEKNVIFHNYALLW